MDINPRAPISDFVVTIGIELIHQCMQNGRLEDLPTWLLDAYTSAQLSEVQSAEMEVALDAHPALWELLADRLAGVTVDSESPIETTTDTSTPPQWFAASFAEPLVTASLTYRGPNEEPEPTALLWPAPDSRERLVAGLQQTLASEESDASVLIELAIADLERRVAQAAALYQMPVEGLPGLDRLTGEARVLLLQLTSGPRERINAPSHSVALELIDAFFGVSMPRDGINAKEAAEVYGAMRLRWQSLVNLAYGLCTRLDASR